MLSPSRFMSLALARRSCVPFNFSPIWFSWTFLMAYYKVKLKSSGDKASPCFRPFWKTIRKIFTYMALTIGFI
jgi:hypothetical protein